MLDEMDVKILRILQEDCTRSVADVGKEVGPVDHAVLAPHPEAGGSRHHQAPRRGARSAERQRRRHGVRVHQDRPAFAGLAGAVSNAVVDFPEVVEFYRMSGEVDYLLRVVVPDIAAYDAFYKKLIARIEISKVSSAFAMEQIKYTTALPLDFALGREQAGSAARAARRGRRLA